MVASVGTRSAKEDARFDRSMSWNKEIARDEILAAGSLETHHVPGVVDLDFVARNDDVNAGAARLGVRASDHYPLSVIHPACELPSAVDAVSPIDSFRCSLPRQCSRDEAIASLAKNLVLRSLGKRAHAPVMSVHDHRDPSTGRAGFG